MVVGLDVTLRGEAQLMRDTKIACFDAHLEKYTVALTRVLRIKNIAFVCREFAREEIDAVVLAEHEPPVFVRVSPSYPA